LFLFFSVFVLVCVMLFLVGGGGGGGGCAPQSCHLCAREGFGAVHASPSRFGLICAGAGRNTNTWLTSRFGFSINTILAGGVGD